MHPSGMFLAAAFFTGFRIYAILQNGFQLIKHVDLIWCSLV